MAGKYTLSFSDHGSPAQIAKYEVGQIVEGKLSGGRLVEAEIKSIIETTDDLRFNVAF